jgi:radical SAM superfamily enzyme YgiQ (UPF0313 family)
MSAVNPASRMVCLIRPPGAETLRIGTPTLVPPLGLAYVAAAVEAAGCPVRVIDAVTAAPTTNTQYFRGYLVGLPLAEIAARIPAEACCVGITCMFTHEWPMIVHLIDLIKKRRPDIAVVVGGEHVTAMPEFSLATSRADALALGEGEETAAELFGQLTSAGSLKDVKGIAYRQDGEIVVNQRRARSVALEAIRRPAWHLFDLKAYHDNRFIGGVYSSRLTVPMMATRGCPYQCTYCSSPNMWTTRWIARDAGDVADEIESYVETYGAGNFPFYDLTAVIQKEWIVAFCQEVIDRGLDITWQMASGTRSEAIDEEVAKLLRRSGMINMAYAPESGSDETRRFIKKKMRTERLFKSVEAAAKSKLSVAAYMVIGFPHDGPREMRQTVAFLREIARRGVNDLGSGYYMALPGTELFRTLYERGRVVIDRTYFHHILNALSFYPAVSYSEHMGRAELFYWKLRFVAAFYATRLRVLGPKAVLGSIFQALSGQSHHSKLQTALRVAIKNGVASLKLTLFGERWMPRDEEERLFAPWDDIHRAIVRHRREAGVEAPAPLDSRELQHNNFTGTLRVDHESSRRMQLATAADLSSA